MRFGSRRLMCAALTLSVGLSAMAGSTQSAVKTGKERLGDKGSDEQRVDNCKVPPEHWGKKARSAACSHGERPNLTH
ncbi:MAG: hypothetical protein QOC72_2597 [Methylobacteriaceae bacterium]|nr:hypothetical protein [Methylobacteriaceae bacterium]